VLARPLRSAFGVDAAYDRFLVRPTRAMASAVLLGDDRGIDAAAVGSGRLAAMLGGGLRRLQNGNVQAYLSALVGGLLVVVIAVSAAAWT